MCFCSSLSRFSSRPVFPLFSPPGYARPCRSWEFCLKTCSSLRQTNVVDTTHLTAAILLCRRAGQGSVQTTKDPVSELETPAEMSSGSVFFIHHHALPFREVSGVQPHMWESEPLREEGASVRRRENSSRVARDSWITGTLSGGRGLGANPDSPLIISCVNWDKSLFFSELHPTVSASWTFWII